MFDEIADNPIPASPVSSSTKACVGCGYCCISAPCVAALKLHGSHLNHCPELHWNGARYVCRLMLREGKTGAFYRRELYAGEGCSSGLNTWRRDVRPRLEEDK